MLRGIRLFCLAGVLLVAGTRGLFAHAQGASALQPQHYYFVDGAQERIVQMDDTTGKNTLVFGETGESAHRFRNPTRLCVDAQGRIYLCDSGNNRVVRVDDISGKGWTEIGSRGNGEKQFQCPVSVQVEPNGRITVLDLVNTRIVQMDDMTGKNWHTLEIPGVSVRFGASHTMPGLHEGSAIPSNIPNVVVDTQGRLYYPDQRLSCIQRIDDISGKNPVTLGTPGVKEMRQGTFYWPQMIGIDAQERIYVLSVPGYLVRVDDMTGKNWTTLYSFAPGVSRFSILRNNTLYAASFGPLTDIRTETSDGKTLVTKWTPPLNYIVDMSAR